MRLTFGKYRDQNIEDVPRDYIEWLLQKHQADVDCFKQELARRDTAEEANGTWIEKLIKTGFRTLAQKHHPDAGGSTIDMQEINAAYEKLKQLSRT